MQVAKTKALISIAVTAKLICVFVFAYADCWFSHDAAQMIKHDCFEKLAKIANLGKANIENLNAKSFTGNTLF